MSAMENASLPSDEWNNATTSSSKDDELDLYLAHIRYLALKVSYIVIGTVGVIDNLFVIIVFAFFIKITDKVSAIVKCCMQFFLFRKIHVVDTLKYMYKNLSGDEIANVLVNDDIAHT